MPRTLRDTSYAEEMNVVLGMTTRWVAAAIKSQYDVAMNPNIASTYEFIEKEDTVTVRSGDREYMLQTQIWECDCEFALTMKLPCRHAMVFKQRSGSPFFIPFAAIAYRGCARFFQVSYRYLRIAHVFMDLTQACRVFRRCHCCRWYGQSRLSAEGLSEVAKPFVAKIFKPEKPSNPKTEQEKYRRAQQTFDRICGKLARLDDDTFDEAMNQFDNWWHNLRQGKTTMNQIQHEASDEDPKHDRDRGGRGGAGAPGTNHGNGLGSGDSADSIGTGGGSRGADSSGAVGRGGADGGSGDTDDTVPATQLAPTHSSKATGSTRVQIKLNASVVPVGRPRLNRNKQRAKAKADLKEYNKGMKLRGLLRDRDVCEVVSALKEIQPGLCEVGSFLTTFQVLLKAEGKPLAWRDDPEYVADTVRYRFPQSTIELALRQLREKLRGDKEEEIALDSDGDNVGGHHGYVVAIEKIGTFTRKQLEVMMWLCNL